MEYQLGYLFGSMVSWVISLGVIYLLAALWEWALFKRILDDPLQSKLFSIGAGLLTSVMIGVLSGTFSWYSFLECVLAALILAFFAHRRGQRLRERAAAENAAEAFE